LRAATGNREVACAGVIHVALPGMWDGADKIAGLSFASAFAACTANSRKVIAASPNTTSRAQETYAKKLRNPIRVQVLRKMREISILVKMGRRGSAGFQLRAGSGPLPPSFKTIKPRCPTYN
jgi:hypothetical protein